MKAQPPSLFTYLSFINLQVFCWEGAISFVLWAHWQEAGTQEDIDEKGDHWRPIFQVAISTSWTLNSANFLFNEKEEPISNPEKDLPFQPPDRSAWLQGNFLGRPPWPQPQFLDNSCWLKELLGLQVCDLQQEVTSWQTEVSPVSPSVKGELSNPAHSKCLVFQTLT